MKQLTLFFILTFFILEKGRSQGYESYSVDIPNATSFYSAQKQSNWCWAACNQMLLNAQGIAQTQDDQVIKLFGNLVDQGAGPNYEMARRSLGGSYMLNDRKVFVIPYVSYIGQHSNDPNIIINHLNQGIPLVMATRQHGRVCIGVDYIVAGQRYQITKIRLLDPNPDSQGVEEFTMQQFLGQGLIGFMTYDVR